MTGVLKFSIETTVSCRLKYFEDKIIEGSGSFSLKSLNIAEWVIFF